MELREQREQTPKANCFEAEGPEMKLHEQREQTPKADCVEAEGPEMHCPPVLRSGVQGLGACTGCSATTAPPEGCRCCWWRWGAR